MTMLRLKIACLRLLAYNYITRMGIYLIQCGLVVEGVGLIHWSTYRSLLILAGMKPMLVKRQADMAQRMEA